MKILLSLGESFGQSVGVRNILGFRESVLGFFSIPFRKGFKGFRELLLLFADGFLGKRFLFPFRQLFGGLIGSLSSLFRLVLICFVEHFIGFLYCLGKIGGPFVLLLAGLVQLLLGLLHQLGLLLSDLLAGFTKGRVFQKFFKGLSSLFEIAFGK